jgi:hypothetical protein
MERILKLDLTTTQAQAEEVAPLPAMRGARLKPPRPSP